MKSISEIIRPMAPHWVGNGFHVRSLFSYNYQAAQYSPFLLLDYAAPQDFPGDGRKRGVGVHPHRGFETVTLVYQGEVEHRDSTGNGGVIGPGDVQWMTAGAGILHEEFHSQTFSQTGGKMQMVQLWINLPAADKMTKPEYQAIRQTQIPEVQLPDDAGLIRLIAGNYKGKQAPAKTFTPVTLWDLRLHAGAEFNTSVPEGWTTMVVVLQGVVQVNDSEPLAKNYLIRLSRTGQEVNIIASEQSIILLLCGEPIEEPIAGHGPFVMNHAHEIQQAIDDVQAGRFGNL